MTNISLNDGRVFCVGTENMKGACDLIRDEFSVELSELLRNHIQFIQDDLDGANEQADNDYKSMEATLDGYHDLLVDIRNESESLLQHIDDSKRIDKTFLRKGLKNIIDMIYSNT